MERFRANTWDIGTLGNILSLILFAVHLPQQYLLILLWRFGVSALCLVENSLKQMSVHADHLLGWVDSVKKVSVTECEAMI